MISPPQKIGTTQTTKNSYRCSGACLTRISGIVLSHYQNHHGMTPGGEYPWILDFTTTTMSKHSGGCPGRAFCSSTPHVGKGNPAVWGVEGCRARSRDVRGISWKKWKKWGDGKDGKTWGVKRGAWHGVLVFIQHCFLFPLIFYQRIYLPPSYTDRTGKLRRPSTIIFHPTPLTPPPHCSPREVRTLHHRRHLL